MRPLRKSLLKGDGGTLPLFLAACMEQAKRCLRTYGVTGMCALRDADRIEVILFKKLI